MWGLWIIYGVSLAWKTAFLTCVIRVSIPVFQCLSDSCSRSEERHLGRDAGVLLPQVQLPCSYLRPAPFWGRDLGKHHLSTESSWHRERQLLGQEWVEHCAGSYKVIFKWFWKHHVCINFRFHSAQRCECLHLLTENWISNDGAHGKNHFKTSPAIPLLLQMRSVGTTLRGGNCAGDRDRSWDIPAAFQQSPPFSTGALQGPQKVRRGLGKVGKTSLGLQAVVITQKPAPLFFPWHTLWVQKGKIPSWTKPQPLTLGIKPCCLLWH